MIDLATDESKGWYSQVLRLPVYPIAEDADPGWNSLADRERYNDLIKCAVDYATSKNVYVIIDWHYIDHYGDKYDETEAFWDWAVPEFKDYSNVLFEIYNEPIAYDDHYDSSKRDYSWASWKNTIAQPITDRIRNIHKADNLILAGAPRWSQLLAEANGNPIEGRNIVYVPHIYPYHWENVGTSNSEGDLSPYLGETVNNLPTFYTEWGFENGAAIPCNAIDEDAYAAGMKAKIKADGSSWTGWCFDTWWQPVMWGDWQFSTLLGSSLPSTGGYQGQYLKDFLAEEKNTNLPQEGIAPTPTPQPVQNGDVNVSGEVDILDALLTARFSAGLNPAGFHPENADVNSDGKINIIDAMLIAKYSAGLIPAL